MLNVWKQDFKPRVNAAPTAGQSGYPWPLNRTAPIDSIDIRVQVVTNAAATAVQADGILAILKRVRLDITDKGTQNVVDISGPALIEWNFNNGNQFDPSTVTAIKTTPNNANAINASSTYLITYTIPLAHPCLTDPVRMFTLFPAHRLSQDPVLTMDFGTAAELSSTGLTLTSIDVEVIEHRVEMPDAVEKEIDRLGGYIAYDLKETTISNVPTTAVNGSVKYTQDNPGYLSALMFRGYLSATSRGNPAILSGQTAFNSDPWTMKASTKTFRYFRFEHLENLAGRTREALGSASTASAGFRGNYYIDNLANSQNLDMDSLDSCIDLYNLASKGINLEVAGNVLGGSGVQLKAVAHRFLGDATRFSSLRRRFGTGA